MFFNARVIPNPQHSFPYPTSWYIFPPRGCLWSKSVDDKWSLDEHHIRLRAQAGRAPNRGWVVRFLCIKSHNLKRLLGVLLRGGGKQHKIKKKTLKQNSFFRSGSSELYSLCQIGSPTGDNPWLKAHHTAALSSREPFFEQTEQSGCGSIMARFPSLFCSFLNCTEQHIGA